jgi:peroxiredoxin
MINVGSSLPDIELVGTDMKPMRLSEVRDRISVIAFFPGAFTSVCTKEMCTLQDSLGKLGGLNAEVIAVSVDSPFSNKAFSEANRLEFRVMSDYRREAVKAFGIELEDFAGLREYTAAKRSVFIVDSRGVVRYKWISDDPRVEPDYDIIVREIEKISEEG